MNDLVKDMALFLSKTVEDELRRFGVRAEHTKCVISKTPDGFEKQTYYEGGVRIFSAVISMKGSRLSVELSYPKEKP